VLKDPQRECSSSCLIGAEQLNAIHAQELLLLAELAVPLGC
jgi:hypothetical protein